MGSSWNTWTRSTRTPSPPPCGVSSREPRRRLSQARPPGRVELPVGVPHFFGGRVHDAPVRRLLEPDRSRPPTRPTTVRQRLLHVRARRHGGPQLLLGGAGHLRHQPESGATAGDDGGPAGDADRSPGDLAVWGYVAVP